MLLKFIICFRTATRCLSVFSGGADSVALLICLLKLRKKYGISVKAMHINHLLRGDEAFRDEKFVDSLCKRLDVPLKN